MPNYDLIDSAALIKEIYSSAHDYGIFTIDLDGLITTWNSGAERIIGFSADEIIGENCAVIFSTEDRSLDKPQEEMRMADATGRAEDYRWHKRKDGSLFWADGVLTQLHDVNDQQIGYLKIFRDITDRKLAETEMYKMANFDRLTGLANRYAFEFHASELLTLAARNGQPLALLLIDLDHFKEVNDSLGHHAGDLLLQQAAQRMRDTLRESDYLARLGGDEFALLQPDIHSMHAGAELASKLVRILSEPFPIDGRAMMISASIGIAVSPQDASDLDKLLKKADLALYRAKKDGKARYHYFTNNLDMAAYKRIQDIAALRIAIENENFFLEYQPKVALPSGDIIGIEALLRCTHPAFAHSPIEFAINLAKESGLMKGLSYWIMEEACKQLVDWKKQGLWSLKMCVNLCAGDLTDPDFPAIFDRVLAEAGADPNQIEFELTEREALDIEKHGIGILMTLRSRGAGLVLDDFGTGYSALSYLRDLPVTCVKIDKSFFADIPHNLQSCAVVSAVKNLSSALGLEVVAEGVETEQQLAFLNSIECDAMQGFLVSPPLPPAAMSAWLASRTQRPG